MTFSLTARCPDTGAFGLAVASSSPAVAARCAHLRPGVGAAASQNITDPRLGARLLDRLEAGEDAPAAMAAAVAADPTSGYRQLTLVDAAGRVAAHSGRHTLGVHGAVLGDAAVAAGNLLAAPAVIDAMLGAYSGSGHRELADRLLDGLRAALAAGGEAGPVHSAGLAVTHPTAGWAETDLRVDWHDTDPIGELDRLWQRWRPLRGDYITRGLNPAAAPGYGVPGER